MKRLLPACLASSSILELRSTKTFWAHFKINIYLAMCPAGSSEGEGRRGKVEEGRGRETETEAETAGRQEAAGIVANEAVKDQHNKQRRLARV